MTTRILKQHWLAHACALLVTGASAPKATVPLTVEQKATVTQILKESDAPLKLEKGLSTPVENFLDAPYWKGVIKLGRSVSDEALVKLEGDTSLSLETTLAVSAARCVRDEMELKRLIHTYTEMVWDSPRTRREREPQPEDLTARHRPLWEAVLLSPELRGEEGGRIKPRYCSEALAAIGDPRSMAVITRARERLITGEIKARRWTNLSSHGANRYAGYAQVDWITPLATIGKGSPEGLEALLEALRLCEAEHPQILTLKNLDLNLHPSDRGVADQLTEVVFLQKTPEGKWLWKDAIESLPEKERTPAVAEVLRIAKENFAKLE